MEADERPHKLRKLSHDERTDNTRDPAMHEDPAPIATASDEQISGSNHDNNAFAADDSGQTSHSNGHDLDSHAAATMSHDSTPKDPSLPAQSLSKKQLKKLRKREEWEAAKADRKSMRKEKNRERRSRQREQRILEAQERTANGLPALPPKPKKVRPILLPVTFLIDCGFDDKMIEKERISLGSQVTRAYSDNSKAPYQAHLVVTSWSGILKERFDTVLHGDHKNWKGMEFTSDDFVAASEQARIIMQGQKEMKLDGAFRQYSSQTLRPNIQPATDDNTAEHDPEQSSHDNDSIEQLTNSQQPLPDPEVVYLTSDSPNTLSQLSPYSTYIIGGLVDHNRHKGICYRTACDRGVKTAKLPIGEFMEMQSRFVLATNHVVEVMIRWLECGDWGEAFMRVMPKRKGGRLKGARKKDGDVDGREGEREEDKILSEDEQSSVEIVGENEEGVVS